MWFTVFCCLSTALVVYCVLNRFNKRSLDLAIHAAEYQVKKELHERHSGVLVELATKDREINRLRELLKLHEARPSARAPGLPARMAASTGSRTAKNKPRAGLELFDSTQPFTETRYNALLSATDIEKVEPAAM